MAQYITRDTTVAITNCEDCPLGVWKSADGKAGMECQHPDATETLNDILSARLRRGTLSISVSDDCPLRMGLLTLRLA